MSDLIDRAAVLTTLRTALAAAIARRDGGDYEDEIRYAIRAVEKAETVDAVRVIRCGECGCWNSETGDCNSVVGLPSPVEADDFCSFGIRKEGHDGEVD